MDVYEIPIIFTDKSRAAGQRLGVEQQLGKESCRQLGSRFSKFTLKAVEAWRDHPPGDLESGREHTLGDCLAAPDCAKGKPIMPILSTRLSTSTSGSSVMLLHTEFASTGIAVDLVDVDSGSFDDARKSVVLAFQKKHAVELTGTVAPATGVQMTAVATFTADGNTPELRQALRTAVEDMPDEPVLAHWLACYESWPITTLARRLFETAYQHGKSRLPQKEIRHKANAWLSSTFSQHNTLPAV